MNGQSAANGAHRESSEELSSKTDFQKLTFKNTFPPLKKNPNTNIIFVTVLALKTISFSFDSQKVNITL